MSDTFILSEGAILAGLGMGVVFVFLTLLVSSIKLMSVITHCIQPAPQVNHLAAPMKQPNTLRDSELMAVIATAVHRYRLS